MIAGSTSVVAAPSAERGRARVHELADDRRGGFYVETLLLCLALWRGLWRSAGRLTRRL